MAEEVERLRRRMVTPETDQRALADNARAVVVAICREAKAEFEAQRAGLNILRADAVEEATHIRNYVQEARAGFDRLRASCKGECGTTPATIYGLRNQIGWQDQRQPWGSL